jgi:hypothetical protein
LWHEACISSGFENIAESLILINWEIYRFLFNVEKIIFISTAYTKQDNEDKLILKLLKVLLTS